jgi:hypothetical protein
MGSVLIVCQAAVRIGVQGQWVGRCSQLLRCPWVIRPGTSNSRVVIEALRRSPSGRARCLKAATRLATTAIQATLTFQCREGHRFIPVAGLLDVVLDVDVGAVPGVQPGDLPGGAPVVALTAISW